ncbi:unnamed protein product (macronuclear) [Paramecium tetraurelia]|uniref:Uncharacterized protein n=1 Tax=Paramecium tetraurelia TaxID=5888 RepID=A0CDT4_PARTE|nr:uncharacterized protein GSPATT00007163001 [Paramecium tetraurelia]CAK68951.1 unnamed protein product [Paramecium tetraurelia]|eukprot:XP_001436348.1 hypothetical protein (macronuclear) [Paramecium tetraurelia strain d4-2]
MDQINQAFQELYYQGECYENVKEKVDHCSYDEFNGLMELYVQDYLDTVQKNLCNYCYNDYDSAKFYLEQVNSHWMRIQNIAQELGKYQQLSFSFKIQEYHRQKFQDRIFQDNKINMALREICRIYKFNQTIEPHFCSQIFQYFKPKITTHQDLMTNWLTYSQCEQGVDEIKDFEKRLECAMTNLPDNEKQLPKLPPNWEKNMANLMKKKKKKL